MEQLNFDIIDILSMMSFAIGYKNLIENREQSAQSTSNEAQANRLLAVLTKRLDGIETLLTKVLEVLENDSK